MGESLHGKFYDLLCMCVCAAPHVKCGQHKLYRLYRLQSTGKTVGEPHKIVKIVQYRIKRIKGRLKINLKGNSTHVGDMDMDSNEIGFDTGSDTDGGVDPFGSPSADSGARAGRTGIRTGKSGNTADSIDMPEELSYSEDHVWVDTSVSPAVLGITAYAADKMGSLVYIDFPAEGDHVRAGDEALEVESAKAISPVSVPVDGTVRYINNAADEDPEIVNNDPYGEGWLIKIELDDDEPELLDSEQYAKIVKKQ